MLTKNPAPTTLRIILAGVCFWGALLPPAFTNLLANQTVAQDSANFTNYAPYQVFENWPMTNGGFGYALWTPLADTAGGSNYLEGLGASDRQVDGNYSFGLYAGSGSY